MSHLKDITGSDGKELSGKKIALCVTASVSITEAPRIARTLMRHSAEVIPVLTAEAAELVSPMIFEWSTGNSPITKITGKVEHVELVTSSRVDAIVIAPCTANTLSKIASGIADDPVSTLVCTSLGTNIPLIIVPAMHEPMMKNPFIQESIARLEKLGVKFVKGKIEESKSKIASSEEVLNAVLSAIGTKTESSDELENLGFLITAGPTREAIDQVRFISNASSGKMGIALTQACLDGGAKEVCLIHGPGVNLPKEFRNIRVRSVVSTEDMLNSVLEELATGKYDVFISAAAPGDYALVSPKKGKISTSENDHFSIQLEATKKIVKVAKERFPEIFVAAFKAEYGMSEKELVEKARQSLEKSGSDLAIANDVSREDIGFGSEENEVIIVPKKGQPKFLKKASKSEIASEIVSFIASIELVSF
ncbi:MAG: bifunctional phosphopantothenoylcysteine decarboxylase/phosphopantothenate--cysteine ligase CoaBC [Thaumarchaeota archaeon]|nr:bifunctional phosphopantothenoylcysteine decarboxylase/phosphopantothenate--cysteine ligase CoaBC [Nitrososphaerota archaeon]